MKGIKFDNGKLRWSLLPLEPIQETIKVLMYGADKYTHEVDGKTITGDDNWKMIDDIPNKYYNALMRHITAWKLGEKKDPETNLPHLAHAICCLLFMLWHELKTIQSK